MSVRLFPSMLFVWMMTIFGQMMAQNGTDYCKLDCEGKENSGCNCSTVGDHCQDPDAKPEDLVEFRRWMVEIHNDLRNHVALGREHRPGMEDGASNMHTIDYDYDLERVARCYMNKCPIQIQDACKRTEKFPKVGQNMMVTYGIKHSRYELRKCAMEWYYELLTLVPEELKKLRTSFYIIYPGCRFTQMMWARSTHIGCARYFDTKRLNEGVPDRNAMMLICNYGPTGNVWNAGMYETGEACSNCAEGERCNNKWIGLCGEVKLKGVNATDMPIDSGAELWDSKYNIVTTVFWVVLVSLMVL